MSRSRIPRAAEVTIILPCRPSGRVEVAILLQAAHKIQQEGPEKVGCIRDAECVKVVIPICDD